MWNKGGLVGGPTALGAMGDFNWARQAPAAFQAGLRSSPLLGSYGEALTFTRASVATFTQADGTVVGLLSGVPAVSALGYLSEPAATNKVIQSQALATTWAHDSNGTGPHSSTNNTTDLTAPDGTSTATKIVLATVTTTSQYDVVYQSITTAAEPTTFSVWLRTLSGASTMYIQSYLVAGGGNAFTTCNVTTTWTRFTLTFTATAAARYFLIGSDRTTPAPVTPAISAQTIYAWGAQVESGSVATSYFPTTTIAGTRAATVLTAANPLANINPVDWSIGGDYTPSAAFALLPSGQGIANIGTTAGAANSASLSIQTTTGKPLFVVTDAASGTKQTLADAAITAAKHTIYGSSAKGVLTVWVDGIAVAQTGSGAGTGLITTQPANIDIGSNGTANQAQGTLANVQVLSRGTP